MARWYHFPRRWRIPQIAHFLEEDAPRTRAICFGSNLMMQLGGPFGAGLFGACALPADKKISRWGVGCGAVKPEYEGGPAVVAPSAWS